MAISKDEDTLISNKLIYAKKIKFKKLFNLI